MLTFLRKIRRSLIETSSLRKYLLYAIGEITLVVIGILIALQINNWNEDRKNNIQAKEYSENLINDIEEDSIVIYTSIEQAPITKKKNRDYMEFVKKGNIEPQQLNDSLDRLRISLDYFVPNMTVFEDLKSTGNLNLFENEERRLINEYYKLVGFYKILKDRFASEMEKEEVESRRYLSNDVNIYEALNFQIPEELYVQGLKHKHNLVELETNSVSVDEAFGPLVLKEARRLIKILKKR